MITSTGTSTSLITSTGTSTSLITSTGTSTSLITSTGTSTSLITSTGTSTSLIKISGSALGNASINFSLASTVASISVVGADISVSLDVLIYPCSPTHANNKMPTTAKIVVDKIYFVETDAKFDKFKFPRTVKRVLDSI
ncbi:MAG: hypothetical protein CL887_00335 [Dehalococcoidia bacterium]|nr:hypothetical protein [Dehalococcoidia bacterium]